MSKIKLLQNLAKVKSEIGKISKDNTNPFFKSNYFDVNTLLEHVEPLLQKFGLVLLQPIEDNKVRTEIYNVEDGQFIFSEMELPNLNDPQKLGSAITYFRRYTLQSLLGLQAEDDDGNSASKGQANSTKNTTTQKTQLPWLNIYEKGTKDLTREMSRVYSRMKTGEYKSIQEIRKEYAISKPNAVTIEAWFKKLAQQTQTA